MVTHHSRLHQIIVDECARRDVLELLPHRVYLDTDAALDWVRLGVFNAFIGLVSQEDPRQPRWEVEEVIKYEMLQVGVRRRRWLTEEELKALLDHPNIWVEPGPGPNEPAALDIARVRKEIEDAELERNPAAETGGSKHMGEATIISTMRRSDAGALMVTGDRAAFETAARNGLRVSKQWAIAAVGISQGTPASDDLWRSLCSTRPCDRAWRSDCHSNLRCDRLTEESAADGVTDWRIDSLEAFLQRARSQLTTLVSQLA